MCNAFVPGISPGIAKVNINYNAGVVKQFMLNDLTYIKMSVLHFLSDLFKADDC